MPEQGMVTLVGAGPGDPGLLTLAGRAAIASAEVVLYDRLVGDGILALLPEAALKINVGKNKGSHPVPQDEINRLIVQHALEGKRVVRLKGGDPYLFGRGAEELEAVREAGVRFRVVPGITSALAAPACAGIPVTHRDYSSSVHILTGHRKNNEPPDIPYRELVGLGGTLVFLMSLSAVDEICANLVKAGMDPETPAALVENGTRADQRRLSATVRTLPEAAARELISPPAVMVVGAVCALADTFDWINRLPLWGRRVLAVSSRESAGRLAAILRELGCAVDEYAGIGLHPLTVPDSLWAGLGGCGWIVFTSRYGVERFFVGMDEKRLDARTLATVKIAAVGSRTARALAARGLFADFVPDEFNGAALGDGLAARAKADERILLFRAEAGDDGLPSALRRAGLDCEDVAAYRTTANPMPESILKNLRAQTYDLLTFASASSVDSFAGALDGPASGLPTACCIGDTTAAAARRHGMNVAVSREATLDSLAELVLEKIGKQ